MSGPIIPVRLERVEDRTRAVNVKGPERFELTIHPPN